MPTKHVSPLLGYNNNVRHKGKVFHIQTEDSGVKYGHIITHLFMDGGRILKSVKTSYAEYVDSERMGDIVREMMKQQHKAMFIALRDGKFDPIIEGAEGSSSSQAFRAAPVAGVPLPPLSSTSLAAAAPVKAGAGPASAAHPAATSPASPPAPAVARDAGRDRDTPPPSTQRGSGELSLDIDAVERAAAAASSSSPSLRQSDDLPPPPPNLFREKGAATGKYRVTASAATPKPAVASPAARAPSSTATPLATSTRTPAGPPVERRYAPTRPASIFGQARSPQGKSIFGDDLISDKSLDEVILSYLAEDLDGEKK